MLTGRQTDNSQTFPQAHAGPRIHVHWKTPPKDNADATRKRPIEWAFSPLVMLLDTGSVESSFDALGDARIKPLPRVRILSGPPANPLACSPGEGASRARPI